MRMGTSALVSALTALPWESDEDTSADEDYTMTRTQVIYPQRPRRESPVYVPFSQLTCSNAHALVPAYDTADGDDP